MFIGCSCKKKIECPRRRRGSEEKGAEPSQRPLVRFMQRMERWSGEMLCVWAETMEEYRKKKGKSKTNAMKEIGGFGDREIV